MSDLMPSLLALAFRSHTFHITILMLLAIDTNSTWALCVHS
jgi:hypothetical protein